MTHTKNSAAPRKDEITKGVIDGACALERATARLTTETGYYTEVGHYFMDNRSSMKGSLCSDVSNRTVLYQRVKQVY